MDPSRAEGAAGFFTETANAAFGTDERGRTLFRASDFFFRNRRAYPVPSEEEAERIKRKLRLSLRIFILLVVPAMVFATGRAPMCRQRPESAKAAGLRPVQIRVPDTRAPGFAEECRRQTALAAASDRADAGLMRLVDAALDDLGTWE